MIVSAAVVALVLIAIGIALVATGDADEPGQGELAASPTDSPQALVPQPPATPSDLGARAEPLAVELRWSADTTAGPIEGFTIYRNGTEIGTVAGLASGRFVDDDALPLVRYVYSVAAFGQDAIASEPAEVRVRTPAAPLSDARLEGTFDVKLREVSTFGYTTSGGDTTGGWTFTPRCGRGSCDVKVAQVFRGSRSVTMERRSARYRARGSGQLGVRCGGTPSTSTFTIDVEVTKAKTVDGAWHAVAIAGTFTHREAAQLGCVAGGAELELAGRLVDL